MLGGDLHRGPLRGRRAVLARRRLAGHLDVQGGRRPDQVADAVGQAVLGAVHPRLEHALRPSRTSSASSRWAATTSIGAPGSRAARGSSSSRGRKQWPSCSEARSVWAAPRGCARARRAACRARGPRASAVAKAMPSTLASA